MSNIISKLWKSFKPQRRVLIMVSCGYFINGFTGPLLLRVVASLFVGTDKIAPYYSGGHLDSFSDFVAALVGATGGYLLVCIIFWLIANLIAFLFCLRMKDEEAGIQRRNGIVFSVISFLVVVWVLHTNFGI